MLLILSTIMSHKVLSSAPFCLSFTSPSIGNSIGKYGFNFHCYADDTKLYLTLKCSWNHVPSSLHDWLKGIQICFSYELRLCPGNRLLYSRFQVWFHLVPSHIFKKNKTLPNHCVYSPCQWVTREQPESDTSLVIIYLVFCLLTYDCSLLMLAVLIYWHVCWLHQHPWHSVC